MATSTIRTKRNLASCPRCGEEIVRRARRCRACSSDFTEAEIRDLTGGLSKTQKSYMIGLSVFAVAGFFVYSLVSSFSANSGKRNIESERLMLEWSAKDTVKAALRDPDSAQFSGTIVRLTGEQRGIVCGSVRSRNGFGGMNLPQRFIVMDGSLHLIEEQTPPEQLQQQWGLLCQP